MLRPGRIFLGFLTLCLSIPLYSAISTNGKVIYDSISGGRRQLFVYDLKTSANTQLTHDSADNEYPTWSPDGGRIAWSRNGDIWIMDSNGSNAHALAVTAAHEASPAWSPDGTQLAYFSDVTGNSEIFVASASGAPDAHNISNDSTSADEDPSWAPGSDIIWARTRAGSNYAIVRQSGKILGDDGKFHGSPSWSPDEQHITYTQGVPSGVDVFVMGSGGQSPTPASTDGSSSDSSYSPDGARIAFSGTQGLSIVNADGTQRQNIAAVPGPVFNTNWGPYGLRVNTPAGQDISVVLPLTDSFLNLFFSGVSTAGTTSATQSDLNLLSSIAGIGDYVSKSKLIEVKSSLHSGSAIQICFDLSPLIARQPDWYTAFGLGPSATVAAALNLLYVKEGSILNTTISSPNANTVCARIAGDIFSTFFKQNPGVSKVGAQALPGEGVFFIIAPKTLGPLPNRRRSARP